jgi:4-aminobutyrate aminotransferase-like enzyme
MIQGQYKLIGEPQIPIVGSSGHHISFSDGQYYDCHAGRSCNCLGHNVPKLNAIRALPTTCDWDFEGPFWKPFVEKIQQLIGDQYDIIIPLLTGTDAVDTAIKLAWECNPNGKILTRRGTYHSGSISGWHQADGSKIITDKWVPYNYSSYVDDYYDPEEVNKRLKGDRYAALLVDSVGWFNGIRYNETSYWQAVAQHAKNNNALLIADEVLTGMGKMGTWSHFRSMGIEPDMIVFGKALTAGHENLAIVCVHKDVTKKLQGRWLAAGNTRSFNETGAAVSLAAIDMIEQQLPNVNEVVIPFLQSFAEEMEDLKISTAGTMMNFKMSPEANEKFNHLMRARGYWHNYSYPYFHIFYNTDTERLNDIRRQIINVIGELKNANLV